MCTASNASSKPAPFLTKTLQVSVIITNTSGRWHKASRRSLIFLNLQRWHTDQHSSEVWSHLQPEHFCSIMAILWRRCSTVSFQLLNDIWAHHLDFVLASSWLGHTFTQFSLPGTSKRTSSQEIHGKGTRQGQSPAPQNADAPLAVEERGEQEVTPTPGWGEPGPPSADCLGHFSLFPDLVWPRFLSLRPQC